MSEAEKTLRLGTRGSLLARTQSRLVADQLEKLHPGLKVELITYTTSADKVQDRPLHDIGGKGLFTREIEQLVTVRDVDRMATLSSMLKAERESRVKPKHPSGVAAEAR